MGEDEIGGGYRGLIETSLMKPYFQDRVDELLLLEQREERLIEMTQSF